MRTRTGGDVETWRCDACGAYTDEPLQVCSECQAKRLDAHGIPIEKKAKRSRRLGVQTTKTKSPHNKTTKKSIKPQKSEEPAKEMIPEEAKLVNLETEPATTVQTDVFQSPEIDDGIDTPQVSTQNERSDELVPSLAEDYESHYDQASPESPEEPASLIQLPAVSSQGSFGDRIRLVYVNTPVPELIKRKFDLDFETFPTVSIGRSPENVVVIPDAGVSRTHAELKKDGDRLILTDLQSSNGTYTYDGKEFQKVEGSVEIRPPSLVKFGTGTILRFVSE